MDSTNQQSDPADPDNDGPTPPKEPQPDPLPPPPPPALPPLPALPPYLPGSSQERSSPKTAIKLPGVQQQPRNISPIAEGSKSSESSVPPRCRAASESDTFCDSNFKPKMMIAIFSVHWFASFAIFVLGLVLSLVPPSVDHACHVYFVMVYLRGAFWFGTYVQHESIKPPCLRLVDQNFNLYRDMRCYRKAPLKIVSIWNLILIAALSYIRTLFAVKGPGTDVCSGLDGTLWVGHEMSPQLFITIFCGLETIALGIFYVPAIKRLLKALQPQEEEDDAPNRTLANQDEIPINQRLLRQAEQVKNLTATKIRLRMEAIDCGALDEDE